MCLIEEAEQAENVRLRGPVVAEPPSPPESRPPLTFSALNSLASYLRCGTRLSDAVNLSLVTSSSAVRSGRDPVVPPSPTREEAIDLFFSLLCFRIVYTLLRDEVGTRAFLIFSLAFLAPNARSASMQ
ncbi:uncharacterized protein G2W53_008411 [Senna tora]|uniref:Uncharacterized protein n=1 Tax=Senna tora TaxID=362788 RepID=A0A834X9F0_9FABA|nr:uncharacterized protein G2W53_008411 [Senna tora]